MVVERMFSRVRENFSSIRNKRGEKKEMRERRMIDREGEDCGGER